MKNLLIRPAILVAVLVLLLIYIITLFDKTVGAAIEALTNRYWELSDKTRGF